MRYRSNPIPFHFFVFIPLFFIALSSSPSWGAPATCDEISDVENDLLLPGSVVITDALGVRKTYKDACAGRTRVMQVSCDRARPGRYKYSKLESCPGKTFCNGGACVTHVCGNKAVESGEECDDGNGSNADGCTTSCLSTFCGDGIRRTSGPAGRREQCDDGNRTDGDRCTNRCRTATCGDGIVFGPENGGTEECDDNNRSSGDGCSATCHLEHACVTNPTLCNDDNLCTTDSCNPSTGCVHTPAPDTTVCRPSAGLCDKVEKCSGVSTECPADSFRPDTWTCRVRNGPCDAVEKCPGDGPNCPDDAFKAANAPCSSGGSDRNMCTDDYCDGTSIECRHRNNTRACSDGNRCTRSDRCSGGSCVGSNPVVCTASGACLRAGTCDPATGSCSSPVPVPNGIPCDDANACTEGDTCLAGHCSGRPATMCNDGNGCTLDSCEPATGCQNLPITECIAGDECCPASCNHESDRDCPVPVCRNGIQETGEECDDGNESNTDGCTNGCRNARCGDRIIGPGEACDDGETGSPTCTSDCQLPSCGNGRVEGREACDDGDTDDDDGCRSNCTRCGDGRVDPGFEDCDGSDRPAGVSWRTICNQETCRLRPCGNGQIDPSEQCDPVRYGPNCYRFGPYGGTVSCDPETCLFDFSTCWRNNCNSYAEPDCTADITLPEGGCGNWIVDTDEGETCDHENFGGLTCRSRGYADGSLQCTQDTCRISTTGCTGLAPPRDPYGTTPPVVDDDPATIDDPDYQPRCSNGFLDINPDDSYPDEVCENLPGSWYGERTRVVDAEGVIRTCENSGFGEGSRGTVQCVDNCQRIDTSLCCRAGEPCCGDGALHEDEECDGSAPWRDRLGGETCESLGFGGGWLSCRYDCTLNMSQCCGRNGDPYADPDEDGPIPACRR